LRNKHKSLQHTNRVESMKGISLVFLSVIGSLTINQCLGQKQKCVDNKKMAVWNGKKCAAVANLKPKQKKNLCKKDTTVRNNCKATCGFCPCKNSAGKFKIPGSKKKVTCAKAPKNKCKTALLKKRCPLKCGACSGGSQCVLQATLAYPKKPGEAPFGYHTNWMAAYVGPDEEAKGCMYGQTPEWCTYKNSVKGYDSASIINVEKGPLWDEEEKDFISSETITVKGVNAKTAGEELMTHFYVYHWFEPTSYYDNHADYGDQYDDHTNAPVLSIKILNKKNALVTDHDGEETGWSHPVDQESHINDGKDYNPDYEGAFYLGVSCDNKCNCHADEYSPFPTYYQDPQTEQPL